jgi:hypothetical protein
MINTNSSESLSMNSSRPYEARGERVQLYKEIIQEKDERIKELLERNEKLEKDSLKVKIQLKNTEDKLRIKSESEYKVIKLI